MGDGEGIYWVPQSAPDEVGEKPRVADRVMLAFGCEYIPESEINFNGDVFTAGQSLEHLSRRVIGGRGVFHSELGRAGEMMGNVIGTAAVHENKDQCL